MILVSLAIGGDPRDIHVGVVNGEACDFESENWREIQMNKCPLTKHGQNGSLSCFFLAILPRENFVFVRKTLIIQKKSYFTKKR